MSSWRPALRIAWREALRARARTLLVLVMVALPVLAVTAAAIVIKTSEVKGLERADRVLGAADARVMTEGRGRILQAADPELQGWTNLDTVTGDDRPDIGEITPALGSGRPVTPIASATGSFVLDQRRIALKTTEVDLADPLSRGLFELTDGSLPTGSGEVVVNDALLAKGVSIGDRLEIDGTDVEPVVVGSGRDASARDNPVVLGPAGSFGGTEYAARSWLVGGGPVTWSQVRSLNSVGFVVTSRAVLADPPDLASVAEQMGYDTGQNQAYAVAALVVVMALLEVVLLAGPAFAVGARRQSRSLALMSAAGATPRQARNVVLASGVVLGLVASVIGVMLGVILGWAVLPLVQRFNSEWLGPFDVPLPWLAAIAGLGLVSAFLAALVPAWIASRQDVVAVLAGRRGDRRPSRRSPLLGMVLLGVGIAGSTFGASNSDSGNGAIWIAACAVISVLGMILIVPVVVNAISKLSGRIPLAGRYAARDAARHRTRTVPAVAAVAATVAGVVALGIANSSDEAENAANYQPQLLMGTARIVQFSNPGIGMRGGEAGAALAAQEQWETVARLTSSALPDASVEQIIGVPESLPDGGWLTLDFHPETASDGGLVLDGYRYWGGSATLVADALPSLLRADLSASRVAAADRALAAGQAVVFSSRPVRADAVRVIIDRSSDAGDSRRERHRNVPAHFVTVGEVAPAMAVLPRALADELGLQPTAMGLTVTEGDISAAAQTALEESLGGAFPDLDVYVERGYQRPAEATIILLVLFTLGGVLMLGGTLTATFLALSDARPDLATLAAVGAAPRTRRAVAASYALVVGFVGALLGAGVGFIPGIAISRPLTSFSDNGPYLAIPWLLIGALVVVLPLLTAAVVGLSARSRLPLVARLD